MFKLCLGLHIVLCFIAVSQGGFYPFSYYDISAIKLKESFRNVKETVTRLNALVRSSVKKRENVILETLEATDVNTPTADLFYGEEPLGYVDLQLLARNMSLRIDKARIDLPVYKSQIKGMRMKDKDMFFKQIVSSHMNVDTIKTPNVTIKSIMRKPVTNFRNFFQTAAALNGTNLEVENIRVLGDATVKDKTWEYIMVDGPSEFDCDGIVFKEAVHFDNLVSVPNLIALDDPIEEQQFRMDFSKVYILTSIDHLVLENVKVNELRLLDFGYLNARIDQNFLGSKTLSNVTISNILALSHSNNLEYVFLDRIAKTHRSSIIRGHKKFFNNLNFNELSINGLVDGLSIPKDLYNRDEARPIFEAQKYILSLTAPSANAPKINNILPENILKLTSSSETLTPHFFNGIEVTNLTVEKFIDDVDIMDLYNEFIKSPTTIDYIYEPVITKELTINGSLDGIDLNSIAKDAIFMDNNEIIIDSKIEFDFLKADSLETSGSFNGYYTSDFITLNGDQVIGNINMNRANFSNLNANKVAGLTKENLTMLFEPIRNDSWPLYNINIKNFKISGKINDILVESLVTSEGQNQTVKGHKTVLGLQTNDLKLIKNLIVQDTIDEIVIQDFTESRIDLNSNQAIYVDLNLQNTNAQYIFVTFHGLHEIDSVWSTFKKILTKSSKHIVSGDKIIKEAVFSGPITSNFKLNKMHLGNLSNYIVRKSGSSQFNSRPTFNKNLDVSTVISLGKVSSVDLEYLKNDVVHTRGTHLMQKQTNLTENMIIKGDLRMMFLSSNQNIYEYPHWQVLLKQRDQNITDLISARSIKVGGNLKVHIPQWKYFKEQTFNVNEGGIFQIPFIKHGTMRVLNISNSNLDDGLHNTLLHLNGCQKFEVDLDYQKKIVFQNTLQAESNINVAILNGKPLNELSAIFYQNVPSIIMNENTVFSNFSVQKLFTNSLVFKGILGDILNNLEHNTARLRKDAVFKGKKSFMFPVNMSTIGAKSINSVDLKDIFTTKFFQRIENVLLFENIHFEELQTSGLINNLSFPQLVTDTLSNFNQFIKGNWTLTGNVLIKDATASKVNSRDFSDEIFFLDSENEQFIEGNLAFHNVTANYISLFGNLSGEDYYNPKGLFFKNEAQNISGNFVFEKVLLNFPTFCHNVSHLFNEKVSQTSMKLQKYAKEVPIEDVTNEIVKVVQVGVLHTKATRFQIFEHMEQTILGVDCLPQSEWFSIPDLTPLNIFDILNCSGQDSDMSLLEQISCPKAQKDFFSDIYVTSNGLLINVQPPYVFRNVDPVDIPKGALYARVLDISNSTQWISFATNDSIQIYNGIDFQNPTQILPYRTSDHIFCSYQNNSFLFLSFPMRNEEHIIIFYLYKSQNWEYFQTLVTKPIQKLLCWCYKQVSYLVVQYKYADEIELFQKIGHAYYKPYLNFFLTNVEQLKVFGKSGYMYLVANTQSKIVLLRGLIKVA